MANNHIADDSKKVRLIDANELKRRMIALAAAYRTNILHIDAIIDRIDTAQIVDAVEVVHGRWIRRGNEMKCSRCLFIYYSNHDDFNYCPNCGEKKDGERRNNE